MAELGAWWEEQRLLWEPRSHFTSLLKDEVLTHTISKAVCALGPLGLGVGCVCVCLFCRALIIKINP